VAAAIAFFDVDETLISLKSMFDFYDYFLAAMGHSPAEQQRLQGEARALLRPGLPREQGNRLFYGRFSGYKVAETAAIGREWFDERLSEGRLFHLDVLNALRQHKRTGREVVLLSGSFPACLDPVAQHCDADQLRSTRLESDDGVYTGQVLQTMIGSAKEDVARDMISDRDVPAAECYAYGDHVSDLGLLRLVGHPVAVGNNPHVIEEAEANCWGRLPGRVR